MFLSHSCCLATEPVFIPCNRVTVHTGWGEGLLSPSFTLCADYARFSVTYSPPLSITRSLVGRFEELALLRVDTLLAHWEVADRADLLVDVRQHIVQESGDLRLILHNLRR